MKVGVICSAGGSASFSALDIMFNLQLLKTEDVYVIVDRECDAVVKSQERNIRCKYIEWRNADDFSLRACEEFRKIGIDVVFLFFTRIITNKLFSIIPTINIHPSLLPGFPGFSALDRAQTLKVRFLGVTLHMVNDDIDAGEIVSQVASPVLKAWVADDYSHVSYIQKTYLMLGMLELLLYRRVKLDASTQSIRWLSDVKCNASANPCLSSKEILHSFMIFQEAQGYKGALQ